MASTLPQMPQEIDIDALAKLFLHDPQHFDVVRGQIQHRVNIIRHWALEPG